MLEGVNALPHQRMVRERWYITLVWLTSLLKGSDHNKLFLVKTENNWESMEGQGHIFISDLIFRGHGAMPRGPVSSE